MPSHFLACALVLLAASPPEQAPPISPYRLDAMPNGYHVQAYDDCGVADRQPHMQAEGMYIYPEFHVNADEKARSVAWGTREITARYTDLDPAVEYVLAVTYANEEFNHRTQGLSAGAVALHEPYVLPKGGAARLLFRVPASAVQEGTLALRFTLEDQVNVVVSVLELWAPKPSPQALHIENVCGFYADLTGRVVNLTHDGVEAVSVRLGQEGDAQPIATTRTQPDGTFRFERALFKQRGRAQAFCVSATGGDQEATVTLPARDVFFEPVRYRPMAASVGGLETTEVLLDGTWRLQPAASEAVRAQPLNAKDWRDFDVPGQWLQQGYDLPRGQTVAVAREFTVPAEWRGYRVILRFDSIHAGTQYWLNGTSLGASENLYTPVEWDVTDTIRVGKTNRLDLAMTVDTVSEKLSYSSDYAFHNLGGIDRSVRLFALPPLHVRTMHVTPELDDAYRDAELKLDLTLTNTSDTPQKEVALVIGLFAPDGTPVEHGTPIVAFDSLSPGDCVVPVISKVTNPLHWSDEKPHLYRLVLELRQAGKLLERIERSIGFRTVEIRGRQFYVNGQRVKLAGACRHEIDPLTGRANTMQYAEADLRLLKQANLNYVRTSHYPPPREVLEAADRLGLYLEVEAPFCWVGQQWTVAHCREVLVPTSAMIDYCHAHPSVAMWSLANESYFCEFFEVSKRLCNDLDPTRPTTFNNPDPNRVCEIANLHYPPMPYDNHVQSDSRPVLLGEYLFPVCHEQTDVAINPGLRELWAAGHADPQSDWGKACAMSFENPPYLLPGALPGAWSHIYHSGAVIGGAIWAAFDEPFYLPGGKKAGYMWVHGPWGLIDAWRRPKPEWWLAKLMFSPVWVTTRQVAFTPGQSSIRVPVENRYAFTDFRELTFAWECNAGKDTIAVALPPATSGHIEIPIPAAAKEGDTVRLRITDAKGELINVLGIQLGQAKPAPLPAADGGIPRWSADDNTILVRGKSYSLVIDRSTGAQRADDSGNLAPTRQLPALHLTRFDFGDLKAAPPYAVLPEADQRVVESVTAREEGEMLAITVKDRYALFDGAITWRIDADGMGTVSYDYTYSGDELFAREIGVRWLLEPACDELHWRRWSEWDTFPADHIGRTAGHAKARRPAEWPDAPEYVRPRWPWAMDQTELGTNDFRGSKFNIYEALLTAPDGSGLRVHARADAHVRACLDTRGVALHVLSTCRLAPVVLHKGDRVSGRFCVELTAPKAQKN